MAAAASSSLSRQLAALGGETRRRTRVSVLFSGRDADALDLPAVYGIGLNGLTELIQHDARFASFESDLFSAAWRDVDRDAQPHTFSDTLNARVAEFCRLLCPYMLSKSAHKALEYLIRRFRVHAYNIDALMEAALPFHDAAVFGRLLHAMDIAGASETLGAGSASRPLWAFLADNARRAVPLPRSVLAAQCVKDTGVLTFLCERAHAIAQEALEDKVAPGTFMTFYGITLLEVLSRALVVPEGFAISLLPWLHRGLRTRGRQAREYRAATYLVLARLATRVAFTQRVFDGLIHALVSNLGVSEDEQREAATCVAALFAAQAALQGCSLADAGTDAAFPRRPPADGAPDAELPEEAAEQWLLTFALSDKGVKCVSRAAHLVSVLPRVCAMTDARFAARCILFSAVGGCARKPKLASFVTSLTAVLPVQTCAPFAAHLARYMLHVHRCSLRADAANAVPELDVGSPPAVDGDDGRNGVANLGAALRQLALRYPDEVDRGLRVALHRRSRSGSWGGADVTRPLARVLARDSATGMSPTLRPRAGSEAAEDQAVLDWVAAALAGTAQQPLSAADGEASVSAENLTLSLALNHASALVRLRAMHVVDDMAGGFVSPAQAAVATPAPALSRGLYTVSRALHQGLEDDDATVVRAALAVHRKLLQSGLVAAASPLLRADEPAPADSTPLARLVSLCTQLSVACSKWTAAACAPLDSAALAALRGDAPADGAPELAAVSGAALVRARQCIGARHVVVDIACVIAMHVMPLLHALSAEDPTSSALLQDSLALELLHWLPTPADVAAAGDWPAAWMSIDAGELSARMLELPLQSMIHVSVAVGVVLARVAPYPLYPRAQAGESLSAWAERCLDHAAKAVCDSGRDGVAANAVSPFRVLYRACSVHNACTRSRWTAAAVLAKALSLADRNRMASAADQRLVNALCSMASSLVQTLWSSVTMALQANTVARRERLLKKKMRSGEAQAASALSEAAQTHGAVVLASDASAELVASMLADVDAEVALERGWHDAGAQKRPAVSQEKLHARLSLLLHLAANAVSQLRAVTATGSAPWDAVLACMLGQRAEPGLPGTAAAMLHLAMTTSEDAADMSSFSGILSTCFACLSTTDAATALPPHVAFLLGLVDGAAAVSKVLLLRALVLVRAAVRAHSSPELLQAAVPLLLIAAASPVVAPRAGANDAAAQLPDAIVRQHAATCLGEAAAAVPTASASGVGGLWLRVANVFLGAGNQALMDASISQPTLRAAVRACSLSERIALLRGVAQTLALYPRSASLMWAMLLDADAELSGMSSADANALLDAAAALAKVAAGAPAQVPVHAFHAPYAALAACAVSGMRPGAVEVALFQSVTRELGVLLDSAPLELQAAPEVASAGPTALMSPLRSVVNVISPALWLHAVKTPTAPGAGGTTSCATVLFAAIVERIRRGPAAAASCLRQSLVRLPLPSQLVLQYVRDVALLVDAATAGSTPEKPSRRRTSECDPGTRFTHAGAVSAVMESLRRAGDDAVAAWLTRATIVIEVIVAAFQAHAVDGQQADGSMLSIGGVPDALPLLEPLFVLVECLVAAPASLPLLQRGAPNPDDALDAGASVWQDNDLVSSIEYAKQMMLSAMHTIASELSQRVVLGGVASAAATPLRARAADAVRACDVDLVMHCVHSTVSTQTRSAALLLLGSLAALMPQAVLSKLLPALAAVGAQAIAREDGYSLSVVQRLVDTVVAVLRVQGPQHGVTLHGLLSIFASYFSSIPAYRRKNVYSAVVAAVAPPASADPSVPRAASDSSRYLASMLALLLQQHVVNATAADERAADAQPALPSMLQPLRLKQADSVFLSTQANDAQTAADLCSSLAHKFAPVQQVRAMSQLLHVAARVLRTATRAKTSPADSGISDDEDASDLDEVEGAGAARIERQDVHDMLPTLLREATPVAAEASAPLSPGERYDVGVALCEFVAAHLASRPFMAAALDAAERPAEHVGAKDMQVYYLLLAERLFDLIAFVADSERAVAASDGAVEDVPEATAVTAGQRRLRSFWRRIGKVLYDALGHLATLLAPASFVTVITALLQHDDVEVQKRSLAFFHDYLRSNYGDGAGVESALSDEETALYLALVEDLASALADATSSTGALVGTPAVHTQVVLDTLATLASYFAAHHGDAFMGTLSFTTDLLTASHGVAEPTPVHASAMLCYSNLCQYMGVRVVPTLSTAVPQVLTFLQWATTADGAHGSGNLAFAVSVAGITVLQAVATYLSDFVHVYVGRALALVFHPGLAGLPTVPADAWTVDRAARTEPLDLLRQLDAEDAANTLAITGSPLLSSAEEVAASRLSPEQRRDVRTAALDFAIAVAEHIPVRVGVPSLLSAAESFKYTQNAALRVCVGLLHAVLVRAGKKELRDHATAVFRCMLGILDLRWACVSEDALWRAVDGATSAAVDDVCVRQSLAEADVVHCLVAMILKLSESQLRPMLLRLLQWAGTPAGEIHADVTLAAAEGVSAPPGWANTALSPAAAQYAVMSRRIAMYRVCAAMAVVLKSLFMPLFAYVLPEAAQDLTAINDAVHQRVAASSAKPGKRGRDSIGDSGAPPTKRAAGSDATATSTAASGTTASPLVLADLLQLDAGWNPTVLHGPEITTWGHVVPTTPHALRCCILTALRAGFAGDTAAEPDGFMSKAPRERLDTILKPLVAQLELPVLRAPKRAADSSGRDASALAGIPGGSQGYEDFVAAYMQPVLSDLLTALRKDTLWKPLHAAVLMLTRDKHARVRLAALRCVQSLHERGGEDALLLVPEALPFLSECMRDEEPRVEACAHTLIRALEAKTGEDLHAYMA